MSVVRAIHVRAERNAIAQILRDYELLPTYEHKVQRIAIRSVRHGGKATEVAIEGRLALLPFSGRLLLRASESGGFDSVLLESSRLVGFSGSFSVRRAPGGDGCIVTHVEQYRFRGGRIGRAIGSLLRPFIAWSIEQEIRRLKRIAEDPALVAAVRQERRRDIAAGRAPVWDPAIGERWRGVPSPGQAM